MHRVVITGMGVASPVGSGVEAFWAGLTAGRCGIDSIRLFDASAFPVRIGGEVKDLDLDAVVDDFPRARTVRDRKVHLGLAAARDALSDALLDPSALHRALLFTGVGLELFRLEDLTPYARADAIAEALVTTLPDRMTGGFLQTALDCTSQILGDRYGFLAGRYVNCSACAAGAQVIGEAWELLRERHADVALAGAADSMLNPLGLGGFSLLRVLSDENDAPWRACRPFDASRKGTVLAEGAAFLVLETLEHALDRRTPIYAEVVGYGSSLDAFRISDPDTAGRGAALSMSRALRAAGMTASEVDCINAHGTGTIKNDIAETSAIKEVLGERAYRIPVPSIKSMTGHMIAASGAAEAVASVLTLAKRRVPPTINLNKADDQCDLDYVPNQSRDFVGETVLSNSFGFGGQNAALLFRRYS